MNSALTVMTTVAGLLFSLSFAILLEELIFGGLFRLFFAARTQAVAKQNNSHTAQH